MAEQYISIKAIHDRVLRHPLMQGVTMDQVVDYAVDFMRIMGIPNIFVNKVATVETHDHRVKLPCDYIETIQVRGAGGVYHYSSGTFHMKAIEPVPHRNPGKPLVGIPQGRRFGELCDDCEHKATCDEFGYDYNKTECIAILHPLKVRPRRVRMNTYMTQNSVMFLSNAHDVVDISYLGVMTDGDGYPMIPDNAKFVRALVAYIKREVFTVLFETGQMRPEVLQNAQQEYSWAVGAASSDMHEIDLPRLEQLSNAMHGIMNRRHEFDKQFITNSSPIEMRIH